MEVISFPVMRLFCFKFYFSFSGSLLNKPNENPYKLITDKPFIKKYLLCQKLSSSHVPLGTASWVCQAYQASLSSLWGPDHPPLITIAIHGFQKVKASIMWDRKVVATAHRTQMMFFPVLSTRSPNTGDMGADMTYTILPREHRN